MRFAPHGRRDFLVDRVKYQTAPGPEHARDLRVQAPAVFLFEVPDKPEGVDAVERRREWERERVAVDELTPAGELRPKPAPGLCQHLHARIDQDRMCAEKRSHVGGQPGGPWRDFQDPLWLSSRRRRVR